MKHTLIIVDPQYDFIEGGKLPVEGGTKALDNVVELIKSGNIGNIIITQDWHPGDHCSFSKFPEHCVKDTHGAQIYDPIMDIIDYKNIRYRIIKKGQNSLEENFSALIYINNIYYDDVEFATEIQGQDDPEDLILSFQESVIICGLAGDICVLNTLKAFSEVREYFKDFYVFKAGTASLDGGSTLSTYMINNDIKNYE